MVDQPATPPARPPHVVVLGGGIAGIAAALCLLDQGHPVTLLEARRFLGGRVFSFTDEETGVPLDNGQHVFLGCCTYFIRLLERLGVLDRWPRQSRLRIKVYDRTGKSGVLAASRLPAPLHLLPALLTYPHLSGLERLRALAALARVRFTNRRQPRLEGMTFYQWLRQRGQSESAIDRLWNLFIVPGLNDDVRDVSATMGLMLFQEGMLRGRHSADVGYALDGLSSAIGEPARRYLAAQGVRLRLGSPARELSLGPAGVSGVVLATGETVTADCYVSALPPQGLWQVLPASARELPFFQRIQGLESAPIVNVHLWYDRPVMDEEFCAFVDGPLQWVFNKGRINAPAPSTGEHGEGADPAPPVASPRPGGDGQQPEPGQQPGPGQYISLSLSAAWSYVDQPREELVRRFVEAMAEAFPRARDAQLRRAVVVKQRQATFRCRPGASELRPGSRTPLANLFLAGEWTDTGWPSTMESAARSGCYAARAIAQHWGGSRP